MLTSRRQPPSRMPTWLGVGLGLGLGLGLGVRARARVAHAHSALIRPGGQATVPAVAERPVVRPCVQERRVRRRAAPETQGVSSGKPEAAWPRLEVTPDALALSRQRPLAHLHVDDADPAREQHALGLACPAPGWLGAQWDGLSLGIPNCPEPLDVTWGGTGAELGHRQRAQFDHAALRAWVGNNVASSWLSEPEHAHASGGPEHRPASATSHLGRAGRPHRACVLKRPRASASLGHQPLGPRWPAASDLCSTASRASISSADMRASAGSGELRHESAASAPTPTQLRRDRPASRGGTFGTSRAGSRPAREKSIRSRAMVITLSSGGGTTRPLTHASAFTLRTCPQSDPAYAAWAGISTRCWVISRYT
eukprot:scaffold55038_cov66-Phaeocystis_antarctica.AAC.3